MLDEAFLKLFYFIYNYCRTAGRIFGFGAFEGFVLYAGIIVWGISEAAKKKVKK